MVSLQHFSANSPVSELVQAIDRDGGCIVDELFSTGFCEELIQDFAPHLSDSEWGVDELGYRDNFYGLKTKRLHGLF